MMFYHGSFSIYQVNLHYTKNKNIKVFKIFRPFLFEGVRTTLGVQTYKIVDAPDIRNKNKYGLGVGISTILNIYITSSSRGSGPPLGLMTYIPFDTPLHKYQEYVRF